MSEQPKPQPIFSLRPVFDDTITKVQCVGVSIIGMTVVTLVVGTLLYLLLSIIGLGGIIRPGWVYGLLILASVVALPALFYEAKRRAYAATAYHFYEDHMEYQDFKYYVTRQRGRIFYAGVTDATQKANFLQEQKHLTTITLYVPELREQQPRSFPGLKLVDITQTQDYLANIIALIEDHNHRRYERDMQAQQAALSAAVAELQQTEAKPLSALMAE